MGWGRAAANLKFRLLSPPPPPPPSHTFQPRFKGEYSTTAHKRPVAATWEMVGRRGGEKRRPHLQFSSGGKYTAAKYCSRDAELSNRCRKISACLILFPRRKASRGEGKHTFFQQTDGPTRFKSSIFRADGDLASFLLTVGSFMEISCHARRRGTVRAVEWPPPNFEYFVGNGTSSI